MLNLELLVILVDGYSHHEGQDTNSCTLNIYMHAHVDTNLNASMSVLNNNNTDNDKYVINYCINSGKLK